MTSRLEYHRTMRRWIPALAALFGLFAIFAVIVPASYAQVNGAPASVTSPGFGGRAVNGTPASVTSLGRNGYAPSPDARFIGNVPVIVPPHDGKHHPSHTYPSYGDVYVYPYPYPVPVPPDTDISAPDEEDEANHQGGPTVFDRRGAGSDSYIPPVQDPPPAHAEQLADANPEPVTPQTPTVLVFKDGRSLELGNYAIVGDTLYDLKPGHPRRIALAALNLDATQKQNEDRGVSFQLPATSSAN